MKKEKCTIDVGYEITSGGQKKHVWLKPEDVATYCEKLRSRIKELENCQKKVNLNRKNAENKKMGKMKNRIEIMPNSEPLFKSPEDYQRFVERFQKAVKPELDRQKIARAKSIEDAKKHWVD